MTYDFKWRNGVKLCEICSKTKEEFEKRIPITGIPDLFNDNSCSDARCPWKNPDMTPSAMDRRVAELEDKYSMWRL
jgi:hypothetical protein